MGKEIYVVESKFRDHVWINTGAYAETLEQAEEYKKSSMEIWGFAEDSMRITKLVEMCSVEDLKAFREHVKKDSAILWDFK